MTSSKFLNGTKIIFEASSNSQGPCRSPANAHRKTAASQDLNNSDLLSLMQIFSSSLKQLNFRFHPRHVPKQNPTNWWCLELQGEFAFYSRPRNCPSFSFLVNISALVSPCKFASGREKAANLPSSARDSREIVPSNKISGSRHQRTRVAAVPAFPKYQKGNVHEKTFYGFHPTFGRDSNG